MGESFNKEKEIGEIIKAQKMFFMGGRTREVAFRIVALKRLKTAIIKKREEIYKALETDLGKSEFESHMCEVGLTLSELSYMIAHTAQLAREKNVRTPLAQFASRSYLSPAPYGTVLIISPWNYPFLLSIDPLIDALAAGNTVVLKPSAYSPATSAVIASLIGECFPKKYAAVIEGGRAENTCLLQQKFDYLFFTGSQSVGREVMHRAAEHLTPVTLELGGKSPCIVDGTANMELAARRIVFGKYLNCGQTCVAPDHIYCREELVEELSAAIKKEIVRQYGEAPLTNGDYGKIINRKHFDRLRQLIDPEKTVYGGRYDEETLRIEPTVMTRVTWEDAVMQEEIFGPVLPILGFQNIDEVITAVNAHAHPLALYLFTENKKIVKKVFDSCGFGGGCVNDTVIHLATSQMGFGGFGESGMGSYHGQAGFRTFSHYRSIVDKKTWMDLPMRYQPYTKVNERLLRLFLK
ncbi:MAG: aldehyde dehydrogenase [Lachnospiraceae bacterium]